MEDKTVKLKNGMTQVTTYYENGKTREIYTIDKDGVKQGPYKSFGALELMCTYKNGKLDGLYEEYYHNGQLRLRCTYKNGKLDGLYESYLLMGEPDKRDFYEDGIKSSSRRHFRQSEEVKLENGLEKIIYSSSDTGKESVIIDSNKMKQGLYESYYNNGQLRERSTYKNNMLSGQFLYYNRDGKLIANRIYKNGRVIEDKLNVERKGLNTLLQSLDKNMEPIQERQKKKRAHVKEYRTKFSKDGR